jgi:hypothetical protein
VTLLNEVADHVAFVGGSGSHFLADVGSGEHVAIPRGQKSLLVAATRQWRHALWLYGM